MAEKTIKLQLQDAGDASLASDDGPIFSTLAKLVEALKRSIPEGTQNAELKQEALHLGRELLRVQSTRRSEDNPHDRGGGGSFTGRAPFLFRSLAATR